MLLAELYKSRRKVVISCKNAGLGDNLLSAANAWYYAQQTKRDFFILWSPSRYMADRAENAFNAFFAIPEKIAGVDCYVPNRIDFLSRSIISHIDYFTFSGYPDPLMFATMALYKTCSYIHLPALRTRWQAVNYNLLLRRKKKRDVIIKQCEDQRAQILATNSFYGANSKLKPFYNALRLRPEVQSEVEAMQRQYFCNKRVIGVHIRYYPRAMANCNYTKYWQDPDKALKEYTAKIQYGISKSGKSDYIIFLATDSAVVEAYIKNKFKHVVTYGKKYGADETKELHDQLPLETARAAVIEMFLLAKSDVLIRYPPGSCFSYYASLYAGETV